jgi:hypothetical protein
MLTGGNTAKAVADELDLTAYKTGILTKINSKEIKDYRQKEKIVAIRVMA